MLWNGLREYFLYSMIESAASDTDSDTHSGRADDSDFAERFGTKFHRDSVRLSPPELRLELFKMGTEFNPTEPTPVELGLELIRMGTEFMPKATPVEFTLTPTKKMLTKKRVPTVSISGVKKSPKKSPKKSLKKSPTKSPCKKTPKALKNTPVKAKPAVETGADKPDDIQDKCPLVPDPPPAGQIRLSDEAEEFLASMLESGSFESVETGSLQHSWIWGPS